jgi:hypothetical protein
VRLSFQIAHFRKDSRLKPYLTLLTSSFNLALAAIINITAARTGTGSGHEPWRSVDGIAYTVRVIQPEGTGVTTLVLEKN